MYGLIVLLSLPLGTQTVELQASRDATLIEHPDGSVANGSGPHFFAGRTGQTVNGIRRGLLRFDVAGALPANAIVESATLTLHMSQTSAGAEPIRLHRVLADWGEGPSSSSGGSGAPAEEGDATWLHTFYDEEYWVHPGGQFVPKASAGREVDEPGFYTWESTEELARDVRLWLHAPRRNFGWILVGNEGAPTTVKRFDSRENEDLALRPVLTVGYRLPGGG